MQATGQSAASWPCPMSDEPSQYANNSRDKIIALILNAFHFCWISLFVALFHLSIFDSRFDKVTSYWFNASLNIVYNCYWCSPQSLQQCGDSTEPSAVRIFNVAKDAMNNEQLPSVQSNPTVLTIKIKIYFNSQEKSFSFVTAAQITFFVLFFLCLACAVPQWSSRGVSSEQK